jgi:hypothetical protein
MTRINGPATKIALSGAKASCAVNVHGERGTA